MKIYNPYKRIKEINEELKPLELEESKFMEDMKKKPKLKSKRYIEVERDIFYLVIELKEIEKVIHYFQKKFNKIEKKYPEHYWRWQFFAKILNPDKRSKDEN